MTGLTIEDLQAIRRVITVASNRARHDAQALVGSDVLADAQTAEGCAPRPKFSPPTRRALGQVEELRVLHDRVGVVLDDMLVAADPEGVNAPAAHARVRERTTKT